MPGDGNVAEKERCQPFQYEILRVWGMKHEVIVPVVAGTRGTVTNMIQYCIGKIELEVRAKLLQKIALMRTVPCSAKITAKYQPEKLYNDNNE